MATNDIHYSVSDNSANVSYRVADNMARSTPNVERTNPYYVGARAYVEQIEGGAVVTVIDKDGTTTATIYNGEKGDKGDTGSLPLYSDTTAGWNAQPTLKSEEGAMYLYTDHAVVDGQNVTGVKFGDGTSYLIDLPFTDAEFKEHALDTDIHITAEEREFWNNKERTVLVGENLILTKL